MAFPLDSLAGTSVGQSLALHPIGLVGVATLLLAVIIITIANCSRHYRSR